MEKIQHFEFSKDIYYYEMIEKYFLKDNNVYFISDFMIFNGKIYQKTGFNICYNFTCEISKAKFKSEIKRKLKENNYKISKLNIKDNRVRDMFNYDNISKKYMVEIDK